MAVLLKNLVQNPNFEDDSSWVNINYSTEQALYGSRSSKLEGSITTQSPIVKPIAGHYYYGRTYIKSSGPIGAVDNRFEMFAGDGYGLNWVFAQNDGNFPTWTMLSSIQYVEAVLGSDYSVRNFVVEAQNPCWTDGLMIIDLTESFGAGNEPTKEWCDTYIPFFVGSRYISSYTSPEVDRHYSVRNLLPDGDMSNELWTGWNISYDQNRRKYGTQSLKIEGLAGNLENTAPNSTPIMLNNQHIYYCRVEGYQDTPVGGVGMYWPIAEPAVGAIGVSQPGRWNIYSFLATRQLFNSGVYAARIDFDNSGLAGVLWVDGAMIVDLTDCFGEGNEPGKAWCDENIPFILDVYTLYILTDLVYDRTQQDVDRMANMLKLTYANLTDEQKAEWDSHRSKGSWNYTDANRIAVYVNYLIDWLNSIGYYIKNSEKIFELWSLLSVFTNIDAQVMYTALDLVAKNIYPDISIPSYTDSMNYVKANEIESLLHRLVDYTERYLLNIFYCAEPYCGEV